MIIIDVRTPQEFQQGHLKDAINIEYQLILQMIESVTDDKNVPIGLYCAAGIRSGFAQKLLSEAGYTSTVNLGSYDYLKQDYPYIES